MPSTTRPTHYDVVVIGARAAGATTAMLLARRGARVLVVDRGTYGSDTLSSHALMRGAVTRLHRWGLLHAVWAAGTPVVRRACFRYRDTLAQDLDIPASDDLPVCARRAAPSSTRCSSTPPGPPGPRCITARACCACSVQVHRTRRSGVSSSASTRTRPSS